MIQWYYRAVDKSTFLADSLDHLHIYSAELLQHGRSIEELMEHNFKGFYRFSCTMQGALLELGCKRYTGVDAAEPREANDGMSHWGDFQPAAIPFVPSPLLVAKRMLEIAELQEGETLLDLGSGDGRILIAAIELFGAKKAIGVEIREDLVRAARKEIKKKGLEDRVSVVQGDLFQVPIDEADVVALYLTAQALDGLRPRLESQLKQGTRIVCHDYGIKGWEPAKLEKLRTWRFWPHKIYLYVVQ